MSERWILEPHYALLFGGPRINFNTVLDRLIRLEIGPIYYIH